MFSELVEQFAQPAYVSMFDTITTNTVDPVKVIEPPLEVKNRFEVRGAGVSFIRSDVGKFD